MNIKFLIFVFSFLFFNLSQGQIKSQHIQKEKSSLYDESLINYDVNKYEISNANLAILKNNTDRDVPWFVSRFKISAGFYEALNNTNISLGNSSGSIGTAVDFENDLGFSKYSPTFLAGIDWRSTSRSKFTLNYYNLRRNSNYQLQKTIDFGDNTYTIDAKVNAYFNTSIIRFSYGYALVSKPNYEFGLSIGSHIVGAKAGIALENTNIVISTSDDFGFTAPLPDFGIWGGIVISDRFAFNGEFNYFQLEVNDVKGTILGFDASFTYKKITNLDISTGLTGFNFKVDALKDNLKGDFKWGNNGVFLKAAYSFGRNNWR
jgi:hypothetical protein